MYKLFILVLMLGFVLFLFYISAIFMSSSVSTINSQIINLTDTNTSTKIINSNKNISDLFASTFIVLVVAIMFLIIYFLVVKQ